MSMTCLFPIGSKVEFEPCAHVRMKLTDKKFKALERLKQIAFGRKMSLLSSLRKKNK